MKGGYDKDAAIMIATVVEQSVDQSSDKPDIAQLESRLTRLGGRGRERNATDCGHPLDVGLAQCVPAFEFEQAKWALRHAAAEWLRVSGG